MSYPRPDSSGGHGNSLITKGTSVSLSLTFQKVVKSINGGCLVHKDRCIGVYLVSFKVEKPLFLLCTTYPRHEGNFINCQAHRP